MHLQDGDVVYKITYPKYHIDTQHRSHHNGLRCRLVVMVFEIATHLVPAFFLVLVHHGGAIRNYRHLLLYTFLEGTPPVTESRIELMIFLFQQEGGLAGDGTDHAVILHSFLFGMEMVVGVGVLPHTEMAAYAPRTVDVVVVYDSNVSSFLSNGVSLRDRESVYDSHDCSSH
jgi:hypothetical protein